MNILITGSNGFVGSRLLHRLLRDGCIGSGNSPFARLTLVDLGPAPAQAGDSRVRFVGGSIADAHVLRQAFAEPVDYVFHLASIPGGAAEKDFALGLDVNLNATLAMLELLRAQESRARLVFASTIAVYGAPMPALVDDRTPLRPGLSYAAHKLIGEILIQDYSRRGWLDGRIVRLPGIVARPPAPSGLLSAFMSDVFWKLAAGEPFTCPVSEDAVAWWMSVGCCVDNLLHAAIIEDAQMAERRDYTLPVLRIRIGEIVEGLIRRFGEDRRALISYAPDETLEQAFGRYPPLDASAAEHIGFRHDGDVDALITNAIARE